jgi:ATP-dependent helicase/nuclease subunit B
LPRQPDAHVFTIPSGAPFAATLARGLLARTGGDPLRLSGTTIFLPTRRAARGFAEIFAREAGGAALLPRFMPLGDVDEDELLLDADAGELALKPAIAPLRRRLLLAELIRRWDFNRGGAMPFAQGAGLAKSLAAVMDEAERQNADLDRLDELAPAALAAHWAEVKDFLTLIVDEEWPKLLAAEGRQEGAARNNQAIRALAARLHDHPPAGLVLAAGSTGSMPATAELLSAIARLPKGAVILPGLDRELDEESWARLDPGHPQYAMKQLLERMNVARGDVAGWTENAGNPPREKLLRETLRPAPTTDAWRALAEGNTGELATGLEGLSLVEAADPAEEAAIIALMLREVLEIPEHTAALVTRDRTLARRVAAGMQRWDIAIDDSAGRPLSHTRAGAFLCLIAEAADSGFAPAPLMALLKHPLAVLDGAGEFRRMARKLDIALRGPRPDAGLAGVAAALKHAREQDDSVGLQVLEKWFARIAGILAPFAALFAHSEMPLAAALEAHIAAAEALAGEELWEGEDGAAASKFVQALREAADGLTAIEPRSYAPLIRALAEEAPVRPAYGSHPRLAILGPLEARMQNFDTIVLGGLNEGSWPAAAPSDPWFSRPMRRTLGLEQPERAIGLSAHDFATLAAGPRVIMTRALKADGAPTVASRWLQRLEQLAKGLELNPLLACATPYRDIARALNDPGAPEPITPPAPRPPVVARPRRLTVTEIETWLRDPYAIYAKHVLGLRKLDPLDDEIGPLERGDIVHRTLERFTRAFPRDLPADAAARLIAIADDIFAEEALPRAVLALWRPRFVRAARWFAAEELKRRETLAEIFVEVSGQTIFRAPAGDFTLFGRADRIDRLKTGGGAIIDYKTGSLPKKEWMIKHLAPQLALEGTILAEGGFEDIGPLEPAELMYIRLTGGATPGETRSVDGDVKPLVMEVTERLGRRIAAFDDEATPYPSRVAPKFAKGIGDYDHLARVREWSASGWKEDQ